MYYFFNRAFATCSKCLMRLHNLIEKKFLAYGVKLA